MPKPIPLEAPVTMATRFLIVVLVFIVFQFGAISIPVILLNSDASLAAPIS